MKTICAIALALAALSVPGAATAKSTPLAIEELPFETIHDVAERSIMAKDAAGRPLVALLKLDEGDFLPPHGEGGGLRLLTVLSGNLSWGDGAAVDRGKERIFEAGTVLVLPAEGGEHWAAAREGDVLLQVVFLRDGALEPAITAPAE